MELAGTSLSTVALFAILAPIIGLGCGDDTTPQQNTGTGGSGGTPSAQGGNNAGGSSGGCVSSCDDGFNCTVDSCLNGKCSHGIGPNNGPTACPPGQYCTLEKGCVASPACADDAQCVEAFKGDACKIHIQCDPKSSLCLFDVLDKDNDGHPAPVCGGDDCDDSDDSVHPGALEVCNGFDDDCEGQADNQAHCGPLEECLAGSCQCRPSNDCGGECTDLQSSAQHCGTCGNTCGQSEHCVGGVCECDSETTECGGMCVYLDVDYHNCGACGHECDGSYCYSGTCGATEFYCENALCAPDGKVLTDGSQLFWSCGNTLYRFDNAIPTPTLLVPESDYPIHLLTVDQAYVYYVEHRPSFEAVMRIDRDGGTAMELTSLSSPVKTMVVDSMTGYILTDYGDQLMAFPLSGGPAEVLTTGLACCGLAVKDSWAYFGQKPTGVARYNKVTQELQTVFDTSWSVSDLAVQGSSVYYGASGSVGMGELTGGSPTELPTTSSVIQITVDGSAAYFITSVDWPVTEQWKIDLTTKALTNVPGASHSHTMAADATNLYFATDYSCIYKLPK